MTAPTPPATALPEAVWRPLNAALRAAIDYGDRRRPDPNSPSECAEADRTHLAYLSREAALRAALRAAIAEAEALGALRTIEAAAHEAARSHAALNDVCSILFCIEDRTEAARLISRVVATWATGQDADAIHNATVNGHEWTEGEIERLAAAVRASDSIRAEETTDGA